MNTMESPAPTHPSNCGGALKAMRDRWSVFAGLVGVTVLAWLYLLIDAARMQGMAMGDPAMMMGMKSWSPIDALLLFLMWSVMMVAMMVPSVTPAVLIYGTLVRRMMPG